MERVDLCDVSHDCLVIVPTVGDPDVLLPTFKRLLQHCDGTRTHIVLMVNTDNPDRARQLSETLRGMRPPEGIAVSVSMTWKPLGFAKACNEGLVFAATHGGIPKLTVFVNDDLHVTSGWLDGMRAALDSETIRLWGDVAPNDYPVASHGRLGIVGPASDEIAGIQKIEVKREHLAHGIDAFAYRYRQANVGNYIAADFISGACLGLLDEALFDLAFRDDEGRVSGLFDDATFPIGGFEDNDLCVRAERAGWRAVVAGDVFVHHEGHRTLDRLFPGQKRGLANRLAYYEKWAPFTVDGPRKLMAVYRFGPETVQDLHYMRVSLLKVSEIVDGIAILLTKSPLEVQHSADWEETRSSISRREDTLFTRCSGAPPSSVASAFAAWAKAVIGENPRHRSPTVDVDIWTGAWNERDERNAAIALAERLTPDWILSVDHDEVIEDRVGRHHFERLMRHPDPLVASWDFGWLNHWDSARLVRQDAPWADGGAYRTGMRGFRLWRANKAAPWRILAGTANGLHCGNCPDHDPLAKRVSAVRFRHFGYLREFDRHRKHARYAKLDPNPDARLTGGGYGHLIAEEGMRLSPYVEQDGIALHMLVYEGEDVEDIARWLDALHGVVDRVVLVWTGAWEDGDKLWLGAEREDTTRMGARARGYNHALLNTAAGAGDWPDSGPSRDLAVLAALHGVEWMHRAYDENMADLRNAALEALDVRAEAQMIGWALFFDPDEALVDPFGEAVALRRMAECSDSWGWLFRFRNLMPSGVPSYSESLRMSRLDPGGVMRMDGRVHEGFGEATDLLKKKGISPNLRIASLQVVNRGLIAGDIDQKLQRYTRMLVRELEDRPWNAGAWVSLGLQYANGGRFDLSQTCFERALLVTGDGFLPYRELALHHLRLGAAFMRGAQKRLGGAHPYRAVANEMLEWLEQFAPPMEVLGNPSAVPLPDLPAFSDEDLVALGRIRMPDGTQVAPARV